MGQEIANIFTGTTKNYAMIAAQSSLVNMIINVFNLSSGFSSIGINRLNYLLGSGYFKAAKRFLIGYMIGEFIFAQSFAFLIYMFSEYIVTFYAGNDSEVAYYFRSLLRFYCTLLFVDFMVWFLFSTSRSLGLINKTLAINLTFTLVVHMLVSLIMVSSGVRHCLYFIANMYF